jgi:hypothetical protein
MAGVVTTKLLEALAEIGIDVSKKQPSNVKTLATKNKSSATKVGLLAAERDTGGNFATVLDIFKKEAPFIDGMNDAEQMAFLNNIMDYKEFGGKSIKNTEGIKLLDEAKNLTDEAGDLQTSIDDLLGTAKKAKDEAEAGKKKALEDLDDFFETGGQPLKKKDTKFLGGSMHEEGQLRTGIRQFLQTEYKNGRLKLDDLDKARVMEYSPMIEHDPILVFKKIYGDEAYKKAGSFPGAFEIGENFKHYEEIFRNNMGEDLLKVKDKKYVGDGKLVLTKQEEVFEPTPDGDDVPFAKGGRASFAGGKLVSEFIALIVKKEPIEAMKEVNKVIGKKGKYKNLTQKDIDKIVADTEDHIFQRDPDNLYVYDDGKTVFDDDLNKEQLIEKESRAMDKADEMSLEESLTTMEGLGATQTAERFRLKQKYPGITDDLLNKILIDDNPQRKAEILATIDEAFRMMEKGKGTEEIIETFKNTSRTKNAKGGRAGFYMGGQSGQSVIEPDLSDIGHGSDALMSRTRLTSPGSQATTSTGLNYLLGEDNDNTRVPFNDGLLVPPSKPYTTDQFEKDSMTLLKGMYGTGPESNPLFYNKIIEKGNILRKQGVERETVIDIIRKNKNKINEFLSTQTTSPKNFKGFESFEMKANGGRIGYAEKGKVSLSDLESLKKFKSDSVEGTGNAIFGLPGGIRGLGRAGASATQRNRIKNKVISSFIYAVDNMDQEKSTYVKNLFNGALQVGYETDTSGIKTDIFEKAGIVPINSETIYSTILNLDLPKEIKAEMSAISDKAGNKELAASLKKNNMGITWDDQSQEIKADYIFTLGTDGNTKIQPIVTKDQDSQISKEVKIDQAIGDGTLNFTLNESDIGNASGSSINYQNDSVTLFADKQSDDYGNTANIGGTVDIPLYLLNKEEKPYISAEINKNLDTDFESKMFSGSFPITDNLKLYGSRYEDDGGFSNDTRYGLEYNFDKPIGEYGNLYTRANIDNQGDYGVNVGFSIPFGEREKRAFNYTTNNPEEAFDMYKDTDGFKYEPNVNVERMPPRIFADGGIAGLRQGYNKGNIVDKGRRGFLKLLGVTAGGVAALKTGLVKLLGKDSGAISKKVIDEVIIDGGTGAPAWLQPLVNKALREGTDKTKNLAYKDAQTVKRLDTPTGQVDVYYDVRTGEVEIDYIGGNTALGESVNMRYTPGIADEGTKGKPADTFEATEAIPEGRMSGPDDYNVEMGENTVGNVEGLYSDTSELAELGGQNLLIKDISTTIKKKKVLKKMNENPDEFASDNLPDYDPT